MSYYDVPEEYGACGTRYTVVNGHTVLVERGSGRIVEVIAQPPQGASPDLRVQASLQAFVQGPPEGDRSGQEAETGHDGGRRGG